MRDHNNIGGGKKILPRLVALAIAAASGHAMAQSNAESNTDESMGMIEEIEVRGVRFANQRAIEAKRDSIRVVDALAVDDIGSLPDFNIGEAVQRLPGITIINDQAEARFISIRALSPDYNYMTIDGVSMAVPDRGGRNPFMDTLPSSLAGKIEVIKSLTPDLEGSGIGGQVNIESRSAFDFSDRFFKATAQLGQYDQNDGFEEDGTKSGTADFVYADKFADDTIGLVVTGNYYKRDSYVPKTFYGNNRRWISEDIDANTGLPDGTYSDKGAEYDENTIGPISDYRYWPDYHNNRTRYGMSIKGEYRPTDNASFAIRSYWNTAEDDEARQSDIFYLENDYSNVSVDGGGNISGSGVGKHRVYLGQFDFTREVWGTMASAEFEFDNGHLLEAAINNTGSMFRNPERWNRWETGKEIPYEFVVSASGEAGIAMGDEGLDMSLYKPVHQNRLDDRGLEEEINEFKVDYGFNNDGSGEGWGFKVGMKYRNTDRSFWETSHEYRPVDKNAVGYTLADAGVFSIGSCYDAGCGADGVGIFEIDSSVAFSNFDAELAANPDNWVLNVNDNKPFQKNYKLDEDVLAGYGMLTHTGDKHFLVFGVRYEETDWSGSGYGKVNGDWEPAKNGGDYKNILPSANFSYELMEDVKLRLAYSHSIGRVPYSSMAPINESVNDTGSILTISRSNPDLDPRKSRNIDLSVEWYLDDGQGILSAGVFQKVLQDEILKSTEAISIEYQGEVVDAEASQYYNAGDDITIKGLELNFVKNLSMLPAPFDGLGVSANATWTDTDFKISTAETAAKTGYYNEQGLLLKQADEVYNAALFYESDMLSARLAYNRTGMVLTKIDTGNPWKSQYETPKEKIDFKATYHLNENLDLSLDVLNLMDDVQTSVLGRDQEITRWVAPYGRAWFLSASYKM